MGYMYVNTEIAGNSYQTLRACERYKDYKKNTALKLEYTSNGFNSELFDIDASSFVGSSMVDIQKRINTYIEKIHDVKVRSSFLYFYGDCGTQKTVFSNWLGRKLIENKISCHYILMQDLIKALWAYSQNNELDVSDYYCRDVLFIDEAFTGRSQWGGYLDDLLKKRITNNKGIIFISNVNPLTIEKRGYSQPTQDLINREIVKRNSCFNFYDKYIKGTTQEVLF
jgi:DNA replication protein DnaC